MTDSCTPVPQEMVIEFGKGTGLELLPCGAESALADPLCGKPRRLHNKFGCLSSGKKPNHAHVLSLKLHFCFQISTMQLIGAGVMNEMNFASHAG